jgi:hypothetical protein
MKVLPFKQIRIGALLCVIVALSACSDKKEPIKAKAAEPANTVSASLGPSGAPTDQKGAKSLADILDAYKTGTPDRQKYPPSETSVSQEAPSPSPQANKSTSRVMPIRPLSERNSRRESRPKEAGGARPGDMAGPRAGDVGR